MDNYRIKKEYWRNHKTGEIEHRFVIQKRKIYKNLWTWLFSLEKILWRDCIYWVSASARYSYKRVVAYNTLAEARKHIKNLEEELSTNKIVK